MSRALLDRLVRQSNSPASKVFKTSMQENEFWFGYIGSQCEDSFFCGLSKFSVWWPYLHKLWSVNTGITSLPIPSAGIRPIFSEDRAAVDKDLSPVLRAMIARERQANLKVFADPQRPGSNEDSGCCEFVQKLKPMACRSSTFSQSHAMTRQ